MEIEAHQLLVAIWAGAGPGVRRGVGTVAAGSIARSAGIRDPYRLVDHLREDGYLIIHREHLGDDPPVVQFTREAIKYLKRLDIP